MHLLDLILLVIIVGWGIAGAFAGFAPQLNTLLSLIFATVGSWLFYPLAAYQLEGLIQSPGLSIIVAPIILFVIILMISKVILNFIFKAARSDEDSGSSWLLGSAIRYLQRTYTGRNSSIFSRAIRQAGINRKFYKLQTILSCQRMGC